MSADQKKTVVIGPVTALTENHLTNPDYTPEKLLDAMLERKQLKNDAALARMLELPASVVSKLRRKQASITAAIKMRIHYITGWSVSDLDALMGLKPQFKTL